MAASRRRFLTGLAATTAGFATPAFAQGAAGDAALRWCLQEFTPSTLTLRERLAEMRFLAEAAAPLRGLRIFVLSEDTPTHRYEQRVLARAFSEIIGVQVIHDIAREGGPCQRARWSRVSPAWL